MLQSGIIHTTLGDHSLIFFTRKPMPTGDKRVMKIPLFLSVLVSIVTRVTIVQIAPIVLILKPPANVFKLFSSIKRLLYHFLHLAKHI